MRLSGLAPPLSILATLQELSILDYSLVHRPAPIKAAAALLSAVSFQTKTLRPYLDELEVRPALLDRHINLQQSINDLRHVLQSADWSAAYHSKRKLQDALRQPQETCDLLCMLCAELAGHKAGGRASVRGGHAAPARGCVRPGGYRASCVGYQGQIPRRPLACCEPAAPTERLPPHRAAHGRAAPAGVKEF